MTLGLCRSGCLDDQNVPTGAGDKINADVVYTNGATVTTFRICGGGGCVDHHQRQQRAARTTRQRWSCFAPDSVFNTTSAAADINVGGRAGYNHNWNPQWNSSVYGAYAALATVRLLLPVPRPVSSAPACGIPASITLQS